MALRKIDRLPCDRDVRAIQDLLDAAPTGAYVGVVRAHSVLEAGKRPDGTWAMAGSYWAPGEPMTAAQLALSTAEHAIAFGLCDTPDTTTASWWRMYDLPPAPA